MMLQMVMLYGASPIIVSEPDEHKREMAYSFGADEAYDPLSPELLQQRLQELGGGADIVIECVGRSESMEQAVRSAGKGGQVLLFGLAAPSAQIQVSPFEIFAKELTIRGSFINPHTHDEAISLVQQRKISVKPLISHRFDLNEVPHIMREFPKLKVTKAIILPQGK
jgi:L-iditol 2-dehydrogenase